MFLKSIAKLWSYEDNQDGNKLIQITSALTASMALFVAGLHAGWPSPSIAKILSPEYPFSISEDEASYIVIIGPVGDIFGGILAAYLVDIIGRKPTILYLALPQILSLTLIFFSGYSKLLLYFARFCGGIADGGTMIVAMYIAEVVEPEIRGLLASTVTTIFIFGVLFINVLGSFCNIHDAALICLVFPLIFLCSFSQMPESPYYYIIKGKYKEAADSLKRLRRKKKVEKETKVLISEVTVQMAEPGSIRDLFWKKVNRKAFFLVFGARTFQQFTGYTAFFSYIQVMLKTTTDISPVMGSSVIILVQLTTILCTSFFIDRIGRRSLFLFSSTACCLTLICLGSFYTLKDYTTIDTSKVSWLPMLLMVLFIISFSSGLGVAVKVFSSEIYSTNIKSTASSLGSILYALIAIFTTKFYQYTSCQFGLTVPLFSFSAATFVGIFFFGIWLPETKGKSLENIQRELKGIPDLQIESLEDS